MKKDPWIDLNGRGLRQEKAQEVLTDAADAGLLLLSGKICGNFVGLQLNAMGC
jgi:hypothetical protein